MTKLLEIKDKIVKFCGKYETYIIPAVKFIIALMALLFIRGNLGYNTRISSIAFTIVLALVCSMIPYNGMVILFGLVILVDLYSLSLEVALITAVLFIVIYFFYFRFAPKDGITTVLTPICFNLRIPYIMPMATGLLREVHSIVGVLCGTVVYYFLDGIEKNASSFVTITTEETSETASKLNVTVGQLLGNKEMYLTLGVFTLAGIAVYLIRRIKVDNAWTLAIISGALIQLLGIFVGSMLLSTSTNMIALLLGSIVSTLIAFVIQFVFMNLDYARTERVQFEDDDYYYYVKAVPKKMVASEEKVVKHFGNTSTMGKKLDKSENTGAPVNKKSIAEELDIDEDLLK